MERTSLICAVRSTEAPLARGVEVQPGSESDGANTEGRTGTWEISSFPSRMRADPRSTSPGRAIGLANARSEHTSR